MERVNLTKYRLNHLIRYDLSKNVIATEGKIYYYPHKTKWENEMKILKMYYRDLSSERVANIEFLHDHKKDLEQVSALVLPDAMVSYYGKDKGVVMPYIRNTNLADLLTFKNTDESIKLKYLKAVGKILEEISLLRKYNSDLKDFALADLHEANVVIDSSTNDVRIVDMDSAYTGSFIASSKYLTLNYNLELLSNKYPQTEDEYYIPNEQTDLYCYHMMILNYLYGDCKFGDNVADLSKEDFYYYLEYLNKIGANENFIDSCMRLYMNQENINPKDYVESLVKVYPRAGKAAFEANKKKLF